MADASSRETDEGLETHLADDAIIDRILQRKTLRRNPAREVDVREVLSEILLRANEFVPSDSGSILLDDPFLKSDKENQGQLYFLACFGVGSAALASATPSSSV